VIAPAFAAALLSTGALSVKATPARALAASSDPVTLEVTAGAPGDARLSATTSVGALSEPRPAGPGRFWLAFTPPRERFPQVALIRLELERGGSRESTWLALPVDGAETLTLETTKPRARVDVTIGERTFGPVQADARGEVEIQVVVPPGVATARVRSVDRLGNQRVKPVDLAPPPFQQVRLAIPAGATASWADPRPLAVEIFAVDPTGAPATAPPTLGVDRGVLGEPSPGPAPGTFVVALRAPEQLPPDRRATITAGQEGKGDSLVVPLRAGPPVRVAVSARPSSYAAGSRQKIALAARPEDARGNAADPDTSVRFTADLGTVEPSGPLAASLALPDAFAGREAVEVVVSAGPVQGKAAVELRAGPAASASAVLPHTMTRAGGPPVEGTLLLKDSFGNPVRGAAPAVSCTVGRAELVKELGQGAYQLRFGAAETDRTGAGRLVARAAGGPELGVADVMVLPVPLDLGLSLGLRAGAQSNFALLHGGGGLAEVAVRPVGRWPLEVLVEGGGSALLKVSQPFEERGPDAVFHTDLRWATGALGVRASFSLGAALSAHGSLSTGAQHTWARYEVRGGGGPDLSLEEAGWSAFGRVAAGVSYRTGPGRLLGELQATYAPPPGQTALRGNLGQATAMVGYLVEVR